MMISNKEGQSWIMAKNLKKMTSKGNDNLVDEISEDFDRFEAWVIEN